MREEQLLAYGGTRELLSQAHESYAQGLLVAKRAGEAIEYLDLALHVHEEEFGHGKWRTRGILKTKFLALLELRRFDDATSVRRTIFKLDADTQNWRRYTEDAWWVAQAYTNAGESGRAKDVLHLGRARAVEHGLLDEVARFELALLDD